MRPVQHKPTPRFCIIRHMNTNSLHADEFPMLLQIGNADQVDDYLVRALWKAEVPGLTD